MSACAKEPSCKAEENYFRASIEEGCVHSEVESGSLFKIKSRRIMGRLELNKA